MSEAVKTVESGGGVTPRPPIDNACLWVGLEAKGWQEGEAGVIEAICAHLEPHIPDETRWCVEFGAGDGTSLPITVEGIIKCDGWQGLLIEPNRMFFRKLQRHIGKGAVVLQELVQHSGDQSIDAIMARNGCPPNPAVMVVDIDSIEYQIVESMASRPIVLCVETMDTDSPKNTKEPYIPSLEESGTIVEDGFDTQLQANPAAFDVLMAEREYALVFRTRFNSIYVRGDMVPRLRKSKLNLGCGDYCLAGYEPVDVRVNGKDVRKLDHETGSQDEVYASHVLEHFEVREIEALVREWVRVLKPGGTLRLAVPDMRKIAAVVANESTSHEELMSALAMTYGAQSYKENFHQWGFTEPLLRRVMNAAGIGFVKPFKPFVPKDCSNNQFSLNLEGTKRWWPKVENPKIALILCQPRFTFTGHEISLCKLAQKFKFEIEPSKGAFWDRDMTLTTMAALEKYKPDLLLYSDYDSLFDEHDVQMLLDAINNDPTMAAIGSVQPSRHHDGPLVLSPEIDYTGDTPQVRFSHFGLTFVRPQIFDELDWSCFWSVPGKNEKGEWDWLNWARSDADITFWRTLELNGFRVCQHNKSQIGHIVQAAKFCKGKGRGVILTPIENYHRHGKPSEAGFKPELHFFLSVPPVQRLAIAKEHGIVRDDELGLPDSEMWNRVLQRAYDQNLIDKLWQTAKEKLYKLSSLAVGGTAPPAASSNGEA